MAMTSGDAVGPTGGAPGTVPVTLETCETLRQAGWLSLRRALWPEGSRRDHLQDMAACLAEPQRFVQYIAYTGVREAAGLAEGSIRRDHVNGTQGSPVAFLEGLYVAPAHRRRGIAKALVAAVAGWGASHGCRELASDTWLDNALGQAVHAALGFQETERVVYFRKRL